MIIGPAISSLIAIPQPLGIFKETSGFPFIFFYSREGWGMSIKVVIRRIAIKVGIKGKDSRSIRGDTNDLFTSERNQIHFDPGLLSALKRRFSRRSRSILISRSSLFKTAFVDNSRLFSL